MAVTTIPSMPAPTHTIIIGASAVLGSAFNTTKNGSSILAKVSDYQSIMATIIPKVVPIINPRRVS